ncbi:MAG: hypothetical protein AAF483_09420 [Planctomycetota bacterium]
MSTSKRKFSARDIIVILLIVGGFGFVAYRNFYIPTDPDSTELVEDGEGGDDGMLAE